MMYKPKLKYIFCLMRKRSLFPTMSVMRYMNSVGIVPQILVGELSIIKELDLWKVKHKEIKSLPDYDVMFSEAYGHCPFEVHWLTESKKRGKTNVVLAPSVTADRNLVCPLFLPESTKLIDGVCMKIEEHLLNYKEFTKGLFLVNVGDSDWDWWKTDEFKRGVEKVKSRFGNKLLVLCREWSFHNESILYVKFCIELCKSLGFKVVINVHPDRWRYNPEQFQDYYNTNIHRHILFKAASHLIGSISSSVIPESLFLGTKAGCDPLINHYNGWGKHRWVNKDTWLKHIPKHINREILGTVDLIFNKKDLGNFLSSSKPKVSIEAAGKAFGRIDVPCYVEYLFKTLDERLKK